MSEATTEKSVLETLFLDRSYGYLNGLVRHYKDQGVLFTETGKMRLAHIAGHIVGLYHAEQKDIAIKMAESLDSNLRRLCYNNARTELPLDGNVEGGTVVEAPSVKAVLGDDGTFGGFSVGWYRPIAPGVYEAKEKEAWEVKNENPKTEVEGVQVDYYSVAELARKMLKITERVNHHDPYSDELTEHRYVADHGSVKVYYTFSHPGGLLYHGPGGGENFAVTLENNAIWSIHT